MNLSFQFAIASDLHIALPHTVPDHQTRFHRTELSIPIFEQVLSYFAQLDLDFLLIPGDLTQDGEPENHSWLSQKLAELPYPVYVVPGNHDVLMRDGGDRSIALAEFPQYYRKFGYGNSDQLYYGCEVLPGVRLIGLNSIFFDDSGKQIHAGRLDDAQLKWLKETLHQSQGEQVLVMVHHNVVEHLPGQSKSPLGRRYMLENAPELIRILRDFGVQMVFTGHLHVQDVAWMGEGGDSLKERCLYDITTGSLVTYPHPFRILTYSQNLDGMGYLQFETKRIQSAPGWADLQILSREFMAERSKSFILRLLTDPPLNLSPHEAEELAPHLRYFWPDITQGDAQFHVPQLPESVQKYIQRFNAAELIDNQATLHLQDLSG